MTALTACLIANAAGQAFTPANVSGFWKGAFADTTRGLNAISTRSEIFLSADGRFEYRQASRSPSLFDDSAVERKQDWKGSWTLQGDGVVLKVASCLEAGRAAALDFCDDLGETDSLTVIKVATINHAGRKVVALAMPGEPVELAAAGAAPKFGLFSLFVGQAHGRSLGAPRSQDRFWALALGESDKVYPDPEAELAFADGRARHGAADGLIARSNIR
jgi:hypothetical protein